MFIDRRKKPGSTWFPGGGGGEVTDLVCLTALFLLETRKATCGSSLGKIVSNLDFQLEIVRFKRICKQSLIVPEYYAIPFSDTLPTVQSTVLFSTVVIAQDNSDSATHCNPYNS